MLSSINKEQSFTHRVSFIKRPFIPPNASVDEVHNPERVSLSTRQYRPSFMPGDEHRQNHLYNTSYPQAVGLIN